MTCTPGSASSCSVWSGSTRTISPPWPLAATLMLPPMRNASPPNIFFSTGRSAAIRVRIRSASTSSYAMSLPLARSGRVCREPAPEATRTELDLVRRQHRGRSLEATARALAAEERHVDLPDCAAAELDVAGAPAVVRSGGFSADQCRDAPGDDC